MPASKRPLIRHSTTRTALAVSMLLLFAVAWSTLAQANLPAGISVGLTMPKTQYSGSEPLQLTITYTNQTSAQIRMLKWNTALEGRINHDFLLLTGADGIVPYTGRVYKRGTPTAADFETLQPGKSRSASVLISDGYRVANQGAYSVNYMSLAVSGGGSFKSAVGSPALDFFLLSDAPQVTQALPPGFSSCSVSRQNNLNTALNDAENIAEMARDDLRNTPTGSRPGAARYVEWFGGYDPGRWNTVQQHFDKIAGAINNQTIDFDCSCTDPFFAYVLANAPYEIYLCSAFWSAPAIGTDSKAGTLIHELSHFTVVADTNDFAYGQQDARNLANNNPGLATNNADNHEYFAENTPFLAMPAP